MGRAVGTWHYPSSSVGKECVHEQILSVELAKG